MQRGRLLRALTGMWHMVTIVQGWCAHSPVCGDVVNYCRN